MKKFLIIATGIITVIAFAGCNRVRRTPGRVYMPDMNYSRAYETYASTDALKKEGVFYNASPVKGTIARGDEMPFLLSKDPIGDTANYFASRQVKSPLNKDSIDMTEAERLYLVNCGICHGAKLDGKGPLFTTGVYPAAPRNFMQDPVVINMPEGQMFYSVTYGKNMMGSYASQLSDKQRWMVIAYIKSKQGGAATTGTKTADSTTTKK
ncbi:MAG TPA: cytochrome c [Chitinophagaceae bacterium]|nr:cytochrome c [Chitinophagaceae bacterium]